MFLLCIRKKTFLKKIDKKLFLEKMVREPLLGTFPVLSEAIKVGDRSVGIFTSKEMKNIFNEYTDLYGKHFPENRGSLSKPGCVIF